MAPSNIEIKTKALARLIKEKGYYIQECEELMQTQESLTTELASKPDDEDLKYQLKKQKEIVNESKRMVPAVQSKISVLLSALRDDLGENKASLSETEVAEATSIIATAEKELSMAV